MSGLRRFRWLLPLALAPLISGGQIGRKDSFKLDCLITPGSHTLASATLVGQKNPMWCWAASTEMAMETVDATHAVDQCKLASDYVGTSCCPGTQDPKCAQGNDSPDYTGHGFSADAGNQTPLSWDQITNQIACKNSPVPFIANSGGGSHMVVIVGYKTDNGSQLLEIHDPKGTAIVDANGNYTWAYNPAYYYITYDNYAGLGFGAPAHEKDYSNVRFGN
jgi:hypothetical protein